VLRVFVRENVPRGEGRLFVSKSIRKEGAHVGEKKRKKEKINSRGEIEGNLQIFVHLRRFKEKRREGGGQTSNKKQPLGRKKKREGAKRGRSLLHVKRFSKQNRDYHRRDKEVVGEDARVVG